MHYENIPLYQIINGHIVLFDFNYFEPELMDFHKSLANFLPRKQAEQSKQIICFTVCSSV